MIVQTIAKAMMNAAAAANTERQYAATQNRKGNSNDRGRMVNQWSVLDPKPTALTSARTPSASSPSATSEVAGLSRRERTSPITNGATV